MDDSNPIKVIQGSNCQIWIIQGTDKLDPNNDNVDIEVHFDSGERHLATFFTLENIYSLFQGNKTTKECKSGLYFWASDMIIVERLTEETIRETIEDLISNDEMKHALTKVVND